MGIGTGVYRADYDDGYPALGYYSHSLEDQLSYVMGTSGVVSKTPITHTISGIPYTSTRFEYESPTGTRYAFRELDAGVKNASLFHCPAQPAMPRVYEPASGADYISQYAYNLHLGLRNGVANRPGVYTSDAIAQPSVTGQMTCGGGRGYADNRVFEFSTSVPGNSGRSDSAGDFHLGSSNMLFADSHAAALLIYRDRPAWTPSMYGFMFERTVIVNPTSLATLAPPRP